MVLRGLAGPFLLSTEEGLSCQCIWGMSDSRAWGGAKSSAIPPLPVGLALSHRTPTVSGRQTGTERPNASRETRCLGVSCLKTPGS